MPNILEYIRVGDIVYALRDVDAVKTVESELPDEFGNVSLPNKANDASVVHKANAETITGSKTFTANPIIKDAVDSPIIDFAGSSNSALSGNIRLKNAGVSGSTNKYGASCFEFIETSPASDGNSLTNFKETFSLPSVTEGRSANASYKIITTKNCNEIVSADITGVVHTSGAEQISGKKDFSYLVATDYLVVDLTERTSLDAGELYTVVQAKFKNKQGTVTHIVPAISVIGTDYADNAYNSGLRFGSTNGTTIVTAGESGGDFSSKNQIYNDEKLYLVADSSIEVYPGVANDGTVAGHYTFPKITDANVTANMGQCIYDITRSNLTFTAKRVNGTTITFTQTWRGFQTKSYQASYTCAKDTYVDITASQFSMSNVSGYTAVAVTSLTTGHPSMIVSDFRANQTGSNMVVRLYNKSASAVSATSYITILYIQNG